MGRRTFSLLGASLSLGAPLGWLAIQWTQGRDPVTVLQTEVGLMAYMTLATMFVFTLFGYIVGLQWERLCEVNRTLRELSIRDALTGLSNNRSFWTDFEKECLRSIRQKEPLQVLVIDLDHFKAVNDTYGHLVGDDVLKAAAQAMAAVMRKDEGIYRVGGEEFAAILYDATSEQAFQVGERLRHAVADIEVPVSDEPGARQISVTASIGAAGKVCDDPKDFQKLYEAADEALYRAKQAGRNRVVTAGSSPAKAEMPQAEATA
jgi:diguanylate cyclase (GGDEF)-like protein